MIFLLHTDPNLVTYLSPMLLHDPVAKVKASASYVAHLQAHDRTAGTPDEWQVSPKSQIRSGFEPAPDFLCPILVKLSHDGNGPE